jgi:hypothetical protein
MEEHEPRRRDNMRIPQILFLFCGLLAIGLSACDRAVDEAASSSSGANEKGIVFGLSGNSRQAILDSCDSLSATAAFGNGSTQTVRISIRRAMAFADGLFHLETLPSDSACRIEIVFFSKDGKTRYTVTMQITVTQESVKKDSVLAPVRDDSGLVLLPVADASIDEQDYNLGAETSNRLYRQGMILLDFGSLQSLKGLDIVRARLQVRGWVGSDADSLFLTAGTVDRGWSEGDGNWYYFNGRKENGYDEAYANYPGRPFPQGTKDPALASGIRWSLAQSLIASWKPVCTAGTVFPVAFESYPKFENAASLDFDVTAALRSMLDSGTAKAFAIRFAQSGAEEISTQFAIFSREFGSRYSPRLEVDLGSSKIVPAARQKTRF